MSGHPVLSFLVPTATIPAPLRSWRNWQTR